MRSWRYCVNPAVISIAPLTAILVMTAGGVRDRRHEGRSRDALQHEFGELRFWSTLRIDPLNVAMRLWTVSGDINAGERIVFRARQENRFNDDLNRCVVPIGTEHSATRDIGVYPGCRSASQTQHRATIGERALDRGTPLRADA